MSDFDAHAAMFVDDLVLHMGSAAAVEIETKAGKKRFPGIVGKLRTRLVDSLQGSGMFTSYEDTCQVSVQCPPELIGIKTRMIVFKHTSGDPSTHTRQAFHVRSIDSVTGELTTVQVARDSIAKIQAAGTEGAA